MTVGDIISATPVSEEGPLAVGPEGAKKIQGRSPWRLAFERLRRDKAAIVCLIVIILIVLMAIFAPLVAKITGPPPNVQYFDSGLSLEGQPVGPNSEFWLGADDLGRDVLVRIAYGARISLIVGVVATFLTVTFGTVVGLAAGYFGKIVDTLLSRLIDVMLSLPFLLFAISLTSIYQAGLKVVIFVLAIF